MHILLSFFVLLPLLACGLTLLIPARNEAMLARLTLATTTLHFLVALGFTVWWGLSGAHPVNLKEIVLFRAPGYEFLIDFYFDRLTATYLLVGSFITTLIALYSRAYMHREHGYKRFFTTILLFFGGYNLTIVSGNFETLFVGWEVLGISSFLLIAFYRDRYLPVKNAVKVFSIYRLGDIGLLLATWLSHHLWHENVTFLRLQNADLVHEHLQSHTVVGAIISLLILVSAAAKSAQLPFSSWLPRAMEGPTPSSAIFYGSLSVHFGVFLLLRTFPFWEYQTSMRVLIAALGLATAFVATGISRVQSSIKSQIAYGSIAQIGLIFVEVAAGLHVLALFHFAGNAFLRTYQLLVSPSAVAYLIREQLYDDVAAGYRTIERFYPRRLALTFYMLGVKEWNLDSLLYRGLWNPAKVAGRALDFLTPRRAAFGLVPLFAAGFTAALSHDHLPPGLARVLPVGAAAIGLLLVLKAFTERRHVRQSFALVIFNHLWVVLAVAFNEPLGLREIGFYLSGVLGFGGLGLGALTLLRHAEEHVTLTRFHGYAGCHPRLALTFLVCCLAVSGFPITPTFIGEDLLFTHIHEGQAVLATLIALSLLLDGLAVIRLYARVFLGPATVSEENPVVAYPSA